MQDSKDTLVYQTASPLLSLPAEIRREILEYVVTLERPLQLCFSWNHLFRQQSLESDQLFAVQFVHDNRGVFQANQVLREEALQIFVRCNDFILCEYPFQALPFYLWDQRTPETNFWSYFHSHVRHLIVKIHHQRVWRVVLLAPSQKFDFGLQHICSKLPGLKRLTLQFDPINFRVQCDTALGDDKIRDVFETLLGPLDPVSLKIKNVSVSGLNDDFAANKLIDMMVK